MKNLLLITALLLCFALAGNAKSNYNLDALILEQKPDFCDVEWKEFSMTYQTSSNGETTATVTWGVEVTNCGSLNGRSSVRISYTYNNTTSSGAVNLSNPVVISGTSLSGNENLYGLVRQEAESRLNP